MKTIPETYYELYGRYVYHLADEMGDAIQMAAKIAARVTSARVVYPYQLPDFLWIRERP